MKFFFYIFLQHMFVVYVLFFFATWCVREQPFPSSGFNPRGVFPIDIPTVPYQLTDIYTLILKDSNISYTGNRQENQIESSVPPTQIQMNQTSYQNAPSTIPGWNDLPETVVANKPKTKRTRPVHVSHIDQTNATQKTSIGVPLKTPPIPPNTKSK